MKKILGWIMLTSTFTVLFIFSVISVGMAQALVGWLLLIVVFGWLVLMVHLLSD